MLLTVYIVCCCVVGIVAYLACALSGVAAADKEAMGN